MQVASVSASFRQGIRMVSSIISASVWLIAACGDLWLQ
jgi:hypothetical protein